MISVAPEILLKTNNRKILGTSATNDADETRLATITKNIQRFIRLAQGNAAATTHVKINGDFNRNVLGDNFNAHIFNRLNF